MLTLIISCQTIGKGNKMHTENIKKVLTFDDANLALRAWAGIAGAHGALMPRALQSIFYPHPENAVAFARAYEAVYSLPHYSGIVSLERLIDEAVSSVYTLAGDGTDIFHQRGLPRPRSGGVPEYGDDLTWRGDTTVTRLRGSTVVVEGPIESVNDRLCIAGIPFVETKLTRVRRCQQSY